MATKLVRKRCEKCGRTSKVRPRERRCKSVAGVPGSFAAAGKSYWCYGHLKTVAPSPRPTVAHDDKLSLKLAHAHAQMERSMTKVKRALTSVTMWQRRVKAIERRIEQAREPLNTGHVRTRAITLPDDE